MALNTPVLYSDMGYGPYEYGSYIGRMLVNIELASKKGSHTNWTVKSIKRETDQYGWTKKIRRGNRIVPLFFTGANPPDYARHDPLYLQHSAAIVSLNDSLRPFFVGIETPVLSDAFDEEVLDIADHLTLLLYKERLHSRTNSDALQYLIDESNRGRFSMDIIVEGEGYKLGDIVSDFSRDFTVDDDNIWLRPRGNTEEEIQKSRHFCLNSARKYSWNISPVVEEMFAPEDVKGNED